jgi:hypothetical protein
MISSEFLRNIICLSITPLGRWSQDAEEILLMIAAHESGFGKHLAQIGGPARGIYQMEPATEQDIWKTYLSFRPEMIKKITEVCGVPGPDSLQMQYNMIYSTIMARLKLWRAPGKLPAAHDVDGMARYCKDNYNSKLGKATVEKYTADYLRLVLN